MNTSSNSQNSIAAPIEPPVGDRDLQFFETNTGRWWLPAAPGDAVASTIKSGRIFDAAIVNEAKRHIRPGTVVLDVGANFGQMTVLFAKLVGPNGHVHAFEAEPFVARILQKNLEANGVNEFVTIHLGAVWHSSGLELVFPEPDLKKYGSFGSCGIAPKATGGRLVRSLTIDELNIKGPISFMKVDVQGSDLFALRGARATILQERMPIVFEFERPPLCEDFETSFSDYAEFVASVGYSFVRRIHLDSDNFLICPRYKGGGDLRDLTIRAAVPYRHAANRCIRAARAFLYKYPAAVRLIKRLMRPFRRI